MFMQTPIQRTLIECMHAQRLFLMEIQPSYLYSKTPRSLLFDRIGASDITKKVVTPDMAKVNREKKKQASFLSEVL